MDDATIIHSVEGRGAHHCDNNAFTRAESDRLAHNRLLVAPSSNCDFLFTDYPLNVACAVGSGKERCRLLHSIFEISITCIEIVIMYRFINREIVR